jgi:HD-GYP domain-containing protein (c-di-GMP phosphodiesterase class II)
MSDSRLKSIEIKNYAKWIARLGGGSTTVFCCDENGSLLYPEFDPALQSRFEQMAAAQQDWWATPSEVAIVYAVRLMYRPLMLPTGARLGVIGLALDGVDPANYTELDQLAEVLGDVAGKIEAECGAQEELDSMAGELSTRYEELRLLFTLNQALNLSDSCISIVEKLLQDTVLHMNLDAMAYIEPRVNAVVCVKNPAAEIPNLDLIVAQLRGDLYRYLSSSKEVLILNEPDDSRRDFVFRNFPFKIIASPVFSGSTVVSTLVILNGQEKPHFDTSDRRICETIAAQVSSLFRMRALIDEMDRFNAQMAAALIETVEAKDPYTRGHSERVHKISLEIGKALRLSPEEMTNLHWGSLLHDIGKIGVPDSVLCKPGRLTRDEYMVICCHPERSYEILRHIERLDGALPAARFHQERYDGKGYPHGLVGKAIPLLARITAVADTYDSITSSRAYRPGKSHEFAMEEIVRNAGTQLDPEIVDVFVALCATETEWLKKILHTSAAPTFYGG